MLKINITSNHSHIHPFFHPLFDSKMSAKDTFKHPKGSYERLNTNNYPTWSNSTRRLLRAICAWSIVAGDEVAPTVPTENSFFVLVATAKKELDDYRQRQEDAAFIIYNSCSASLRSYIDQIDCPKLM